MRGVGVSGVGGVGGGGRGGGDRGPGEGGEGCEGGGEPDLTIWSTMERSKLRPPIASARCSSAALRVPLLSVSMAWNHCGGERCDGGIAMRALRCDEDAEGAAAEGCTANLSHRRGISRHGCRNSALRASELSCGGLVVMAVMGPFACFFAVCRCDLLIVGRRAMCGRKCGNDE
jgi:hypothetical protein